MLITKRWFAFLACVSALVFAPSLGQAQEAAEQHTESAPAEFPEERLVLWTISAGAVLNTGNTESLQFNGGTDFRLVDGRHGLTAQASWVAGLAGEGYEDQTANDLRGKLRYDFFLTPLDALFAAVAARRDRFAGLNPRFQAQLGYLRYFLREAEDVHRLWGEIGYDLTYDRFDYTILDRDDPMPPAGRPDSLVAHSARLFLGYDNHINPGLTFLTGLEVLINVDPGTILVEPDGTERTGLEDVRVNWDSALRFHLVERLQGEIKFTLAFDNVPAVGAKKLDTTTTINVIYTLVGGTEEGT